MDKNNSLNSILIQPEEDSILKDAQFLVNDFGLSIDKASDALKALNAPRADILSDFPAEEDSLNFGIIVRTISNIIFSPSTQTPISICIDGHWGSGKTSILKMIQSHAKTMNFPCIWINAWNITDILKTVDQEMIREFELEGEESMNLLSKELGSPYWSNSGLDFGDFVGTILAAKEFESSRLIVFVDDLDRAFPEQILEVFSTLKLILESTNCVFVLGMDIDVVARSLARAYIKENLSNFNQSFIFNVDRDSTVSLEGGISMNAYSKEEENSIVRDFGYQYLEKIIQITVKVPDLTKELVSSYLEDLNIVPEVIEIIEAAPENETLNPRRLKQYLNWLSLVLQVVSASVLPERVSNLTALRTIFLRSEYPQIYSQLANSDCILDNIDCPEFVKNIVQDIPRTEFLDFQKFLQINPVLRLSRRRTKES